MKRWFIAAISCCLLLPAPSGAKPRAKAKASTKEGKAKGTPAQLVKQGDALIMIGSFEEAAKAYEAALKADPSLVYAKVKLAHCRWRTGHAAEAKKALEELVSAGNPTADALSLLGDIYLSEKDNGKAAAVLEKLVALRPTDMKSRMQLADCYRQLAEAGNAEARKKALALYEEIEQKTDDSQVRRVAMEAALTMRFGEVGKKILAAKEAIAGGKEVQALKDLNALAKQHPSIGYLHYLRGMACLAPAVDDRKTAAAAFKRAAKDHYEAAYQLGVLLYQQGDLEGAVTHLTAATKKDPRHQSAYYHLGLVYREKGDDKKAVAAWTAAVRIDYSSPVARWAQTKMQVLTGNIRGLAPGQVIDPSSEILLGKRTCEMIEKRWPLLKDPRLEARLNGIMEKLVVHSDRPRRDLRYRVAVINVPVANAVTVPNGKIYVFTGLVDLVRARLGDKDDYYASVLAHELAHTALRHGVGMIKMTQTQESSESYWQLARLMGAMSRTHEYEADQYGALYAYRAGYDPTAGILLHRKMLQQKGEIPEGMTHPRHKERIERLSDYLLELRGKVRNFHLGLDALNKRDYDKAVDHLELFLGVFPESAAGRNNLGVALHRKALSRVQAAPIWRRSTDIDPNARIKTIALRSTEEEMRQKRIDKRLLREASAEYAMVLKKDPRYPPAYNNLATALSDLGDLKSARRHLETAIKLNPKYKEAYNNLGVVLAQLNDFVGASGKLAQAVQLDSKYAAAHFNLALVFEKLKRNPEAAREWDSYMQLDPKSGWTAVAKARRAALKL